MTEEKILRIRHVLRKLRRRQKPSEKLEGISPISTLTGDEDNQHTLANHFADFAPLTLNLKKSKITGIKVKEGTHQFAFWFVVSTYLPVLTACLCPLTNMISIAALVTKWRHNNDGNLVSDTKQVYILNAVSLALGCVGNGSVLLNFGRKIRYKVSISISIFCFYSASFILMSACILAGKREIDHIHYHPSEGFWFAVITTILYFGCASTCLINFIGASMGKYPADLNLTNPERGLIIYNFLLAVWFIWGAGLFSSLNNISYGSAMYFCVVSLLTIGFGDIAPHSQTTKGLILAYSFTGVIILGLIIAMIRSMMKSTGRPVLFWNNVEMRRKIVLQKIKSNKDLHLSHEDTFDIMRSIRKHARKSQNRINSIVTIIIFVLFWLLGAMLFKFAEGWSYFNGVYFCFLCFLTIGYGDVTPTTAAGRCIFIVWAIGAVPLMTALISNTGDQIYSVAMKGVDLSGKLKLFYKNQLPSTIEDRDIDVTDIDSEEERSVDQILSEAQRTNRNPLEQTKPLFENLRGLIGESIREPNKRYGYEQWRDILNLMELEDEDIDELGLSDELFWIGDKSPLRFPINEPNFLLFLLFSKLEALVTDEAFNLLDNENNTKSSGTTARE